MFREIQRQKLENNSTTLQKKSCILRVDKLNDITMELLLLCRFLTYWLVRFFVNFFVSRLYWQFFKKHSAHYVSAPGLDHFQIPLFQFRRVFNKKLFGSLSELLQKSRSRESKIILNQKGNRLDIRPYHFPAAFSIVFRPLCKTPWNIK